MKPMIEAEWVKREFNFDAPVELFPALVERVRGTPARLEEMVRSYPRDIMTKRMDDRWSIQESVGHLLSLDELHEGRLEDFEAGAQTLRAADMTNRKTYEADYNSANLEELLLSFREARMRFVGRLELLGEEQAGASALHPRLGKQMRVIDLAYFVAEHDDHHLAEITYLARALGQHTGNENSQGAKSS